MTEPVKTPREQAMGLEDHLQRAIRDFEDDGSPEAMFLLANFTMQLSIARAARMRGVLHAGQVAMGLVNQPSACLETHPLVVALRAAQSRPDRRNLN